jgi:hypothetical protein
VSAGHVDLPDQPELYGVRDTSVADGWAQVLCRYPAHIFGTFTFRPTKRFTDKWTGELREVPRTAAGGGMHPEAAAKAFRFFVSKINRELYGNNWGKRWHGGLQWALGQEFHKDGRLHFHALISAPTGDLWELVRVSSWHRWWLQEFGFNRIERPRSQADVADYVSKYVTKDGEVDFSKNFGQWIPPRPGYTREAEQGQLPGCDAIKPAPRDRLQAAAAGRATNGRGAPKGAPHS